MPNPYATSDASNPAQDTADETPIDVTQTGSAWPSGGNVLVNSDNIAGSEADTELINKVVEACNSAGYNASASGIGPNYHVSDVQNSKDTYVVCIVGGACAGTFKDMCDTYYQNYLTENNNKAGIAFYSEHSKFANGLKGVSHLSKAHDDNFTASSFDGIDNPIEYLRNGGIGYCESTSREGLPPAVVSMLQGGGGGEQTGGGSLKYKDKTFEDCIRRICASTDSVFFVESNAAFLFPYTEWMQIIEEHNGFHYIYKEDVDNDAFEFHYANDGFYNSVTVKYDGGSVTQKYEDLVNQYGEINYEYEDEEADRATAMYKANTLLAQFVRAYNNSTRLRTMQYHRYLLGNFYVVEDPASENKEFYMMKGMSMRTQEAEPMYVDMDLGFGPDLPDEIAEPNMSTGTGGGAVASGTLDSICQDLASRITYGAGSCSWEDAACVEQEGTADCYGMSHLLYTKLTAAGITCRVIQYASSYAASGTHRTVQVQQNGTWTDIDYRKYGFHRNFNNMQVKSGCKVIEGGAGGEPC